MPTDDISDTVVRVDAALDQWVASVKEERAEGRLTTPVDLAQYFGVIMGHGRQPPTGMRPLLILTAHAVHRMLAAEERATAATTALEERNAQR